MLSDVFRGAMYTEFVCGGLWCWLERWRSLPSAPFGGMFLLISALIAILWDRTPHRFVERYQCVRGTCCLQYQGQKWKQSGRQNCCPLSNKRCVTSKPKIISFINNNNNNNYNYNYYYYYLVFHRSTKVDIELVIR